MNIMNRRNILTSPVFEVYPGLYLMNKMNILEVYPGLYFMNRMNILLFLYLKCILVYIWWIEWIYLKCILVYIWWIEWIYLKCILVYICWIEWPSVLLKLITLGFINSLYSSWNLCWKESLKWVPLMELLLYQTSIPHTKYIN